MKRNLVSRKNYEVTEKFDRNFVAKMFANLSSLSASKPEEIKTQIQPRRYEKSLIFGTSLTNFEIFGFWTVENGREIHVFTEILKSDLTVW